jgi:hypothetical protein
MKEQRVNVDGNCWNGTGWTTLFPDKVLQDCANMGIRMIGKIAVSGHDQLAAARNNLFIFFHLG